MSSRSGKGKDMYVLASPKRGRDVTEEQGQDVHSPNTESLSSASRLRAQHCDFCLGLKERPDVDRKRGREGAILGGRNSMSQGSEGGGKALGGEE